MISEQNTGNFSPLAILADPDLTGSPAKPYGLGIDFGTSNSAAAIFDGKQVTLVQLESEQAIMPSASYIDRELQAYTGQEAIDTYIACNQGRKVELSAEVLGEARAGTGQVDSETKLPTEAETHLV